MLHLRNIYPNYYQKVLLIPFVYFIFSIIWIFLSDYSLSAAGLTEQEIILYQVFKGSAFVLVTTVVMYILVRNSFFRLIRSEERYRTMQENAPIGVFVQSENRIVYVNERLVELFGARSREELYHKSIFDLIHPDYQAIVQQRIQTLTQEMQPVESLDEVWFDLNQNPIEVEVSATPIRYDGVYAVMVFVKDISQRKQMERYIQEREERFRNALTELPFPTILHTEEGRIQFINNAWREISGYSLDEIPTIEEWTAKAYGNGKDKVRNAMQNLYSISQPVDEGEFEITCKDGEKRVWEFSSSPFGTDPNGHRQVISVAKDITEKIQAQRKLQKKNEFFEVITNNIPIMIAHVLPDLKHQWVNRAWEDALGWKWEEIRDVDILRKLFPQDELYQRACTALQKESDGWNETQICCKDGTTLDSLWMNVRLSDDSRIAIGIDISNRKKLESQIRQSQKMESIGRLAGGIAHDFNNIIMIISANTEFAMQDLSPHDENYEFLNEVKDAAQRAAKLTSQLLAFSRKQVMKVEIVDLNRVILDVDKMLRRMIGEDIEYVTLPKENLWKIKADPSQLEQIIFNLAVNARDAMPKGGHLTIETDNVELDGDYANQHAEAVPGRFVMLAVTDNGSGIAPGDLDKIFEPFFTTKDRAKGTGLGLSMVHGIVKQSGGNIYVYSEPGMGTTFKLYFPATQESPDDVTIPEVVTEAMHGTERILIVEDEPLVRNLLHRILTNAGYTVFKASYAAEALEIFEQEGHFDLLITDVILPKMSGKELVDLLTNAHPSLPVLYISGYTGEAIIHHGVLEEGVYFLQKPFTQSTLLQMVRNIIENSRA